MRAEFSGLHHHDVLKRLGERLRVELPTLVDETEADLVRLHAELVAGIDAVVLRDAIAVTHRRFIAMLEGEDEDGEPPHVGLGVALAEAGVPVEVAMAGYRVGGQVGWRHVQRHVVELRAGPDAVMALATASLAYMDELAANSLEGFARQAAALAGRRAREHQALLDALLAGRDATHEALAARWPLPPALCIGVLLDGTEPFAIRRVVAGSVGGTALLACPADAVGDLADASIAVALGPAVPPPQASLSLTRARRVAALVAAGVLPDAGVLRWEDHLADLVLHADGPALEALRRRCLAPLQGLPPARARMLRETLGAWLAHPGQPSRIAARLHLHHQTVRYRVARLRDAFGDALDDADARFELDLALRSSVTRSDGRR